MTTRFDMLPGQASHTAVNYWLAFFICFCGGGIIRYIHWEISPETHIGIELGMVGLAGLIAALGLRLYRRCQSPLALMIAVAFFGNALLTAVHAYASANIVSALAPWSGSVEQLYLSAMLCLSYLFVRQSKTNGAAAASVRSLLALATSVAISCVALAAVLEPIRTYYPQITYHRPQEAIPGLLFGFALYGFLRLGDWRYDKLHHWLVMSLVVSACGQILIFPFSSALFDADFNLAHTTKFAAYLMVLTGLLRSLASSEAVASDTPQRLEHVSGIGIGGKIALLCGGLVFVGIAPVGIVSYVKSHAVMLEGGKQRLIMASNNGAERIKSELTRLGADAAYLAGLDGVGDGFSHAELSSAMRQLMHLNPSYLGICYVDIAAGKTVVGVYKDSHASYIPVGYREAVPDRRHAGIIARFRQDPALNGWISDFYLKRSDGLVIDPKTPMVTVAVPVGDALHGAHGLMIIDLQLNSTFALLRSLYASVDIYLTTDGGEFLMHPDPDREFGFEYGRDYRLDDEMPNVARALKAASSNQTSTLQVMPDDVEYVFGMASFSIGEEWNSRRLTFINALDREIFERPASEIGVAGQKVATATLLIALLVGWVVAQRLVKPVRYISDAAQLFGQTGKRVPLPTHGRDEIGILARAIERMMEQVNERAAELRAEIEITKKLSMAVEHAMDSVVIMAPDLRIQYVNAEFEKISGFKMSEVVGKTARDLNRNTYDPEKKRELLAAVSAIRPWKGTMRYTNRAGGIGYEAISMSPVIDSHGELSHFVSVIRDVTEQKRMEDQLRQSQKLESIGQLAAGIAHEINTPTQFVGDNTRFLQDSFGSIVSLLAELDTMSAPGNTPLSRARLRKALADADLDYLLAEIPTAIGESLQGIERVKGIVQAMKEFSHPSQDMTPVNINRAITSTITVTSSEWKYTADIRLDLDDQLPYVTCMPGEFNQVILNIVINAAHAIGDKNAKNGRKKGLITISTRRDGDWVEIHIADDGEGMPADIRERIFDPFFTTKEVGKGTGQGLAIARNLIVKRHGGTIEVESTAGEGTCFIIRLPIEQSVAVA